MRKKTRDMDRIRFRDIKPYCVVASLDDLCGPESGVIHLPHWVRWQDDKDVDISDLGGARMAYQALLAEGDETVQAQLLNRRVLQRIWPQLHLDQRVRDLWESRFPELTVADVTQ